MADPFFAEIRIVSFNFPPRGWAWCDGQLLPLSQNTALFSLLGTNYGGNGLNNFALPNLQGRVPMGPGQGPGLSLRSLGESGGTEAVTLTQAEVPAHSHALRTGDVSADNDPSSNAALGPAVPAMPVYANAGGATVAMAPEALSQAGGGQPHNNLQPYLTSYFIIALQGIFPQRP
ncbi:MAG: tail fiber protein [Myxococcaceae bacterium]